MADSKTKIDWKLELIQVPVSDIDRAKAFYVDQVGFNDDHDHQFNEEIRFVQLTPPGSACSIALGTGLYSLLTGRESWLHLHSRVAAGVWLVAGLAASVAATILHWNLGAD